MSAIDVQFHHVNLYVDSLKPLQSYKDLETQFNTFSQKLKEGGVSDVTAGRQLFSSVKADGPNPDKYSSLNQDVVEQLITAAGLRVTAINDSPATCNLLLKSQDENGVKVVVSAITKDGSSSPLSKKAKAAGEFDHFSATHIERYYANQAGRQGVGVLSFQAMKPGSLDEILANYQAKHPTLAAFGGIHDYQTARVLDVAAYYEYDMASGERTGKADVGTVLRFVESSAPNQFLPGYEPVKAEFDGSMAVYADHWVSNVVNRNVFLDTLHDTLGFTPKVDFNAGVVAAGEAIIESTVTGNTSSSVASNFDEALTSNSQVYLPINNALSEVGHVHLYLKEIGQGIQHIANRVANLPAMIQRANQLRKMTGMGFTFLNIPRSYYGVLTTGSLEAAGVSAACASAVHAGLQAAGVMSFTGEVSLDITDAQVAGITVDAAVQQEFTSNLAVIQKTVSVSRWLNLRKFLGDHLTDEDYFKIVENQILVDIQGQDVLYQIFTSCILQRVAGQEAPFFEFIQRACSKQCDESGRCKPIKPGCGGFGIRNFLTLFLSIEVSKAMLGVKNAAAAGNDQEMAKQQHMVDAFTQQLDESNPILTCISDAMTAEGEARDAIEAATTPEAKAQAQALEAASIAKKEQGNKDLQTCSEKYRQMMVAIRQS